jgi:hypothetical protein
MSEFSRYGSGSPLPSETRREDRSEHERELIEQGAKDHLAREAHHDAVGARPWWKFWAKP